MENYKDALELWSIIFKFPGRQPLFNPNESVQRYGHETYVKLFKKYPKAYDKLSSTMDQSEKEITLDEFLKVIWGEASREIKKLDNYAE
jgi:hypothetical protein